MMFDHSKYISKIANSETMVLKGRITQVIGLVAESQGPFVALGELCYIYPKNNKPPIMAEVVGFKENRNLLMPIGELDGIGPGCDVIAAQSSLTVAVSPELLGRILDGIGNPIDGLGPVNSLTTYPLHNLPPPPLTRKRITAPLSVGVRAIDGLLTLGCGQRVGIMAGSGVGKSTLLGMIARNTQADINVIALIGERGREVREFIERDLGEAGLQRSVVVIATSDQPALVRVKGAMTATAIAEYYRDQGANVLLMMDSVTRFAMAQREIGLTIGEPPATRGYTPSVFAMLPKLLERSGMGNKGSITGIYTVLVEGDDMNEPIADSVRSILDGHIVLSRNLAAQNHYPSIDVLNSVSRVMYDIIDKPHWQSAQKLRSLLATYREAEDLINIGAYVTGSNPTIDESIRRIQDINLFLRQDVFDQSNLTDTVNQLKTLFQDDRG